MSPVSWRYLVKATDRRQWAIFVDADSVDAALAQAEAMHLAAPCDTMNAFELCHSEFSQEAVPLIRKID